MKMAIIMSVEKSKLYVELRNLANQIKSSDFDLEKSVMIVT